jgi:hypothetical protein
MSIIGIICDPFGPGWRNRQSDGNGAPFCCFAAQFLMRDTTLPNQVKPVDHVVNMCYILSVLEMPISCLSQSYRHAHATAPKDIQ